MAAAQLLMHLRQHIFPQKQKAYDSLVDRGSGGLCTAFGNLPSQIEICTFLPEDEGPLSWFMFVVRPPCAGLCKDILEAHE